MINKLEIIELMYLNAKGFNYLVRNEIGSVEVFKNKPHKNYNSPGYITWVERGYPMTIEEIKGRQQVTLGKYTFVKFEDNPILLSDIVNRYVVQKNR